MDVFGIDCYKQDVHGMGVLSFLVVIVIQCHLLIFIVGLYVWRNGFAGFTAVSELSHIMMFSCPISLAASIPTTPYPQPKSKILSSGKNSAIDNMANVPQSILLGEKFEEFVSNFNFTFFISVTII